jgi:hypothetical protein
MDLMSLDDGRSEKLTHRRITELVHVWGAPFSCFCPIGAPGLLDGTGWVCPLSVWTHMAVLSVHTPTDTPEV